MTNINYTEKLPVSDEIFKRLRKEAKKEMISIDELADKILKKMLKLKH